MPIKWDNEQPAKSGIKWDTEPAGSSLNIINADSPIESSDSDFVPGIQRGVQNLQASFYGTGAMAGRGLQKLGFEDTGQKLWDVGLEGYRRNVKEAEQYPKRVSFKDVYTGKAGIGGAIDWAQGTLGELVPSMAEAAIGAVIGSAIAPGPGTVAGGLASRTILRKGIDQVVKKLIKEGVEGLTESQIRKQVTKQVLKTLGGKIGIGASVFPMEAGSMYGDLFESHGIDAPETALLFGSLSTSLEFFGGNSKLVDLFVDSLAKGYKGIAKRTAKEILTTIPEEALQEGGQQLFQILNTIVNTDEKLLTAKNLEDIVENMAAGAIGGGVGAVTETAFGGKESQTSKQEDDQLINQRAENIISNGPEIINASIIQIGQDVDAIKNWLNNPQAVLDRTNEYGTTVEEVTANLNKRLELSTKLQERLMQEVGLTTKPEQTVEETPIEETQPIEGTKSEEDLYWEQQEKEIRDQIARRERVKETLNSSETQLLRQNQEEINRLWKEYEELESRKAQGYVPDSIDMAGRERQQQIDSLYWPTEQELDERHNQEIAYLNSLKEKATTPDEKALVDKLVGDFQQRMLFEKERVGKEAVEGIPIEGIQPEVIDPNRQPDNFLTRATERLGGEVEPDIIFNKENYRREVEAKDELSPFINEQQVSVEDQLVNQRINPYPTKAQKEAGNYAKPTVRIDGHEIKIENPNGYFRSGVHENGNEWTTEMNAHYGYFVRSKGKDGDQVDVFIKPATTTSPYVYIVDQINPETGKFDEHKVIMGATSEEDAKEVYLSNYDEGWQGLGAISRMTKAGFKKWLGKGTRKIKALKYSKDVQFETREFKIPVFSSTEEALAFGKTATPEQINLLKSKWLEANNQTRRLHAEGKLQEAFDKSVETQFYREALEAAGFDVNQNARTVDEVVVKPETEIRETQTPGQGVQLADIQKIFPGQNVTINEDGQVSVRLKNGRGFTIDRIKNLDNGFAEVAIQTGQMSEAGKILGATIGGKILLDSEFADNKTLWHENKHVLDNLGIITKEDDTALNREFNKLRKAGKLQFDLSTHEDPIQRMRENRANTLAQLMTSREEYRSNSTLNKIIQKVLDFFTQLYLLGQRAVSGNQDFQTATGLAREAESGRLYDRKVGNQIIQTTGLQLETREPLPDQLHTDEEYIQMHREKASLIQKIKQSARMDTANIGLTLNKMLTPISTRLKDLDLNDLAMKMRWLDFDISQRIMPILKAAQPMLELAHPRLTSKGMKMSAEDRTAWDRARKDGDSGKILQLARKYNFESDLANLRELLNKIRQDAIDVGIDVGYIEEYWPRIIKDQAGFLQAIQNSSHRAVFTEALKEKADKLGMSVDEFIEAFPDSAADISSNLIISRPSGIGGPGNTQNRVFETIPQEFSEFYLDSDAALMQYVYNMSKKIEARKFFGKMPENIAKIKAKRNRANTELIKLEQLVALERSEPVIDENKEKLIQAHEQRINDLTKRVEDYDIELETYKNQPDYKENIGAYINDLIIQGRLHKKDEKALRDILEARFHERGTIGKTQLYKNISYIIIMGNPYSAITQIGDLAWALHVGEVWNPMRWGGIGKNLIKAAFKKSNIEKEDLGIERIAQEFSDFDSMSKLVSKVFKLVQLDRIDAIGKELLINNAFDTYKRQVSTKVGRKKLLQKIRPIFGNESNNVINELIALSKDSSMEPSANIKMLLYSRLLDFQPVSLSEMPEYYLKGGNLRVLYMLKTYTLKQFDVFRNEVWRTFKEGDVQQKLEAMRNLIVIGGALVMANAGADEIKDWMSGKETKFSDNVIENILTMGGANRYVRMQARREGIGTAALQMVLPPYEFINALGKDVTNKKMFTNPVEESRFLKSIPLVGKLAYWHAGRGSEYKQSIEEQDFSKAGKEFRKFKKDFEESDNKRLFLTVNPDTFKQMKIYENFKKAINNITALINKLKKLEQTTNVRKRIGQLTERQDQMRKRYFELVNQ